MDNTKQSLKDKILSFEKLEYNWDSYNANPITKQSIVTACKYIDTLSDVTDAEVFPMPDGGVQVDIGKFTEIEIFDSNVTEIQFDPHGEGFPKIINITI